MVVFEKGNEAYFEHMPHPSRQTPSETVKNVRNFLQRIGATP
jgi:hypothetical protein